MKKKFLVFAMLLAPVLSFGQVMNVNLKDGSKMTIPLSSIDCVSFDMDKDDPEVDPWDIDYTSENANAWGIYAASVAKLLQEDSQTLYGKWKGGYADAFKKHNGVTSDYTSAESCIEQIIDGCSDIANEVGISKIAGPYELYLSGQTEEALYSVESAFSWHSRDDFKNNILSIANSLVGKRLSTSPSEYDYRTLAQNVMAGTAEFGPNIIEQCMKAGYSDGDKTLMNNAITVWQDVCAAWTAIDNIPQPFRNNIGSSETEEAMTACANLVYALSDLKKSISSNKTIDWQATVDNYVDVVVVPTYEELAEENMTLYLSVISFQSNPTNAAFEACCSAWLKARAPWETSEAFLFGPVSYYGLDPSMDSSPIDYDGVVKLLQSLNSSNNNDEEIENIGLGQAVRGYHTLEFLIFRNGNPRTVK